MEKTDAIKKPQLNKQACFELSGHSMQGLLKPGDEIHVRLFDQAIDPQIYGTHFHEGDIILLKTNNEWVLHRLLRRNKSFVTKGDQSQVFDESQYIWGQFEYAKTRNKAFVWPLRNSFYKKLISQLSSWNHRRTFRPLRGPLHRFLYFITSYERRFLKSDNYPIDFNFEYFKPTVSKNFVRFEKFKMAVNEHGLETFAFKRLPEAEKQSVPDWGQRRKEEALRNQMMFDELQEWSKSFTPNVKPTLLKGASLLLHVYEDYGDRKMSDLDLLVTTDEKSALEEILIRRGFSRVLEDHGAAHKSKSMWTRPQLDSEFIVELHTKMYWYQDEKLQWNKVSSSFDKYQQLDLIDELLYLCIHLSYNHNFQKLFWLVDIHEFLKKYEPHINWDQLCHRAQQLRAEKALASVLFALEKVFRYRVPHWPLKRTYTLTNRLITVDFLFHPYRSIKYYVFMKHLLQDSLYHALKSDYYRLLLSLRWKWEKLLAKF